MTSHITATKNVFQEAECLGSLSIFLSPAVCTLLSFVLYSRGKLTKYPIFGALKYTPKMGLTGITDLKKTPMIKPVPLKLSTACFVSKFPKGRAKTVAGGHFILNPKIANLPPEKNIFYYSDICDPTS